MAKFKKISSRTNLLIQIVQASIEIVSLDTSKVEEVDAVAANRKYLIINRFNLIFDLKLFSK
jgi:hypothetical protein